MAYTESVPDLLEKIRELEKRIRILENSDRLTSSSIGQGGITIKNTGSITVENTDADGSVVTIGRLKGYDKADGSPQRGFVATRDSGEVALAVWDSATGDGFQQFLAVYDRAGNIVLGDDTASGVGLARPYLPLVWVDADNTRWPRYGGNTFRDIWTAIAYKQHPKLAYGFYAASTAAGTTGEYQVLVNGTVVDGPKPLTGLSNTGLNLYTNAVTVPSSVPHMGGITVTIQYRVTGGTGSIFSNPYLLYGLQT